MQYKSDNPLLQESYYDPATPTIVLGSGAIVTSAVEHDDTPAWLPRDARPLVAVAVVVLGLMVAGVVFRAQLFSAGFSAGWAAREAAGSVWNNRGWGALVVFSIVGVSLIIHGRNRTYTYPELP